MSLNADFADAGPMHLWFLYYLVYYYLAFATATYLLRRFSGPVAGWLRAGFRMPRPRAASAWIGLPALIVATSLLMLTMDGARESTPPSPSGPLWHVIFRLRHLLRRRCWAAFGNRELVDRLKDWAWLRLGVGADAPGRSP